MTVNEIKTRRELSAAKYNIAIEIRERLEAAKKDYERAGGDWDGDDMDNEICTLVFEE